MDYQKIKEQCGDINNHCWGSFVVFKEEDIENVKNTIKDIDEYIYDYIPEDFKFHVLDKKVENNKLIINEKIDITYICKMYFDLDEFYSKCEEKNLDCIFISDTYDNCINVNYPSKEITEISL